MAQGAASGLGKRLILAPPSRPVMLQIIAEIFQIKRNLNIV
jgi:hypothetical protein